MTFGVTRILSCTFLKGEPSSFTLELPPYRKVQIGKVIVRSILDRTLFVLGRAVCVAAPFGIIIFLLSNVQVLGVSVLAHVSSFLDPIGRFMGLDGVILLSFILAFPANEIVLPVMLMTYMHNSMLIPVGDLSFMRTLLVSNGWGITTAICMLIFTLCHWPCSTTLITVWKETKSVKWTFLSFAVPTVTGVALCAVVNFVF
jgi:ferrous iron transport protein B